MSKSRDSSRREPSLTTADVAKYEKLLAQLRAMRDEFALLSKAKPNDALNALKLGFVNEKLTVANTLLVDDFQPFDAFTTFAPESLTTNSDVVLVLTQYIACFAQWREAHVYRDEVMHKLYWNVSDGQLEA